MNTGGFISSKLDFKGNAAVVAISISFFIIIVSVAISAGFRNEIRSAVSRTAGDVQIQMDDEQLEPIVSTVQSIDGVESVTPVIYAGGMVKVGDNINGIMVKGVPMPDSCSLRVSIPDKLASILEISPGDPLITYFAGDKVKIRKFTVNDIYDSSVLVDNGDALTVIAPLRDVQKITETDEGNCTMMEVILEDRYRNPDDMRFIAGEIAIRTGLYVTAASDRYSQLFSWLEIIDANVLVILILLSVVAGFNMVSGLLIMLFRNISTIGTLKTLGMSNAGIGGVFLRVASRTTITGMVVGNILAVLFCLIQDGTHIIALDPDNYFVSFVPVKLNVALMIAADAAAYAIIMLMELLPTLFIAKVDPARNIRVK